MLRLQPRNYSRCSAPDLKFREDASEVVLHCELAQPKLSSDFFVRKSQGQTFEDLSLAAAQRLPFRAAAAF
jgi:hypothetical protein